MGGADVFQDLVRIETAIALANPGQRLVGAEPATGASANVIFAEKRTLGSRIGLKQSGHGDLCGGCHFHQTIDSRGEFNSGLAEIARAPMMPG